MGAAVMWLAAAAALLCGAQLAAGAADKVFSGVAGFDSHAKLSLQATFDSSISASRRFFIYMSTANGDYPFTLVIDGNSLDGWVYTKSPSAWTKQKSHAYTPVPGASISIDVKNLGSSGWQVTMDGAVVMTFAHTGDANQINKVQVGGQLTLNSLNFLDSAQAKAGMSSTDAETVLAVVEQSATIASEVATAVADLLDVKKLAKLLTAIGPFLNALGPALAIISMFLPKEDSPELKYMKEKFGEVNSKLDIIDSKLDQLQFHTEAQFMKSEWFREIRSPIANMKADRTRMMKASGNFSKIAVADFVKTCETEQVRHIKTYIRNRVLTPGLAGGKLFDTVKSDSLYSLKELKAWGDAVSLAIAEGAILHAVYSSLRVENGSISAHDRDEWIRLSNDVKAELTAQEAAYRNVPAHTMQSFVHTEAINAEKAGGSNWAIAHRIRTNIEAKFPYQKATCVVNKNSGIRENDEYKAASYYPNNFKGGSYGSKWIACAWSPTLNGRKGWAYGSRLDLRKSTIHDSDWDPSAGAILKHIKNHNGHSEWNSKKPLLLTIVYDGGAPDGGQDRLQTELINWWRGSWYGRFYVWSAYMN